MTKKGKTPCIIKKVIIAALIWGLTTAIAFDIVDATNMTPARVTFAIIMLFIGALGLDISGIFNIMSSNDRDE